MLENEYEIIPKCISLENLRKNGNPDLISKSLSNYIETGHMPVSNFFMRAEPFYHKLQIFKAVKMYRKGIEFGDANCLFLYAICLLSSNIFKTGGNMNDLVKNIGYNNKLHIAYPFILEAVIHGDLSALRLLVICLTDIVTEHLIDVDLFALLYFWMKRMEGITKSNFSLKIKRICQVRALTKECMKKVCPTCGKDKSVTGIPLKRCSGCKYVYYCGKSCAKIHWVSFSNEILLQFLN